MKKFLLTLITIFFAYYCAFKTSGASEKKGLFGSNDSNALYKFLCAITGSTDTTDANSVFKRGQKYLDNQQYDLAIKDMKKVLSLDSSNMFARLVMSKAYLGLGDTTSSIVYLLKHVKTSSETAEAYYDLGNIFKSKGLADSSFYYFKKSYEANSSDSKVNYEIARYYYKTNKPNDAIDYIQRALEPEEYNLDYRNLRRLIYIKQNRQDLADQDYQFIVNNNAEYFGNYKEKAEKEKNSKNYQAAVENYKLALQEQIDNRELLEARAWVYHSLNRYDSALIDFNRVVELNPDYLSYFNVAYTLDLMDKVKEAVQNYDKSIELKSDYYLSYNNRGYEYYKLKDYKKSEADYTKSIELKDDYYLSLYNRGLLYYETKKYAKAVEDYKNALKYGDNGLNINYSLALAYDDMKKKEDAINSFNEFLKSAGEGDSIRINYANKRIAELNK
jgi:tetratricopeptide (TPR) repeat protein